MVDFITSGYRIKNDRPEIQNRDRLRINNDPVISYLRRSEFLECERIIKKYKVDKKWNAINAIMIGILG